MAKLTDEQKKILVDKWNAGVPASVIAAHLTALGAPSTKNSIIGHANRFRHAGGIVAKKKAGRRQVPPRPMIQAPPMPDNGCRFIEGHPTGKDSDYCGVPHVQGSPYCAEHRARTIRVPGQIET